MSAVSIAPHGAVASRPVYLGDGDADGVFGVYHAAARPGGVAVLLCPPFGNGELCSYRARRDWALHLAGAGHATLRIDLPGTGDSAGGPRDPGRFASWVTAVGDAGTWLHEQTGARVACIGIGLGGVVACAAVSQGLAVEDLVLWAVPARGRAYVRELRAFSRLEASWDDGHAAAAEGAAGEGGAGAGVGASAPGERPNGDAQPPDDGSFVTGGFAISGETAAALDALDLTALPLPGARTRRVLLLERDAIGVDERLREFFAGSGVELTVLPGPGYGRMMAEPYESRSPTAVFAAVEQWLAGATSPPASRWPRADEHGAETAQLALADHGARIRETPFDVEQPQGRLTGVLAEPLQDTAADLCAVFLNAGALRRIGPNRMWVEAARRFAARGVPTLRIDLAGIGDADGDDSGWADDASFYTQEFVTQTRAALDALQARGAGSRFVLAGLCSGAFWAFHAALEDERVTGAMMVNTRALFWDGSRAIQHEAAHAHKLLEARLWLKLARGGFSIERVLTFARAVARLTANLPARLRARVRARRTGGDRLDHALDRLQQAGQRLTFVFGPREQLRLELERSGRLSQLARRPNVVVELLDGEREVHTLEPLALQRQVHALLDAALERELRRG